MRTLEVKQRAEFDPREYVKRSALETDYSTLVQEDTVVTVEGHPQIAYFNFKDRIDFDELRRTLKRVHYPETVRTGGLKTRSRVFGYQPRITLRRDYCTATSLRAEHPDQDKVVCDYGRLITMEYIKQFPERFQRHKTWVEENVLPEWHMEQSIFTSGIINKNNPLKYHYDAGNIKGVNSCMLALKHNVSGGYLAVPEYDLGFEIADGSLIIFDGQSLLHGVTPIKTYGADAYRYTVVYYTLQGMWKCEPLSAELARIRAVKTKRERKRAGIVTQHGEEEGEV